MTIGKTEMSREFVKVPTPNFEPSERWRIMKNILVISCAFMVNFTAFMGASNLQSSVNADQSLGTFTLSAIYGSLLFSNILLPALIISWLGCKWTMSVSILAYMPFIASQFYPKFYTMIPAGLSVGLGGGPLWCAKCTYLTVVAEAYSTVSDIAVDVLVTRFFGLFFMFYQMAQVWGNLISSAVLSYGIDTVFSNVTLNSSVVAEICGANFCGVSEENENPNLQRPPVERIYLISGIYLGCMILACLIIAFAVDPLSRYDRNRARLVKGSSGFKLLAVTLKLLKEKNQLLILPITLFIGAEQAFLFADYNASFVSCAWGINNIGYVMICFGITNAIAALFTGAIVKLTGRKPVMIFAFCLHLSLFIYMLRWKPTPEQGIIFFLLSGLWGVCDSIWLVQVNALSGILFPGREEAAFANFRLWESTGSVITYVYSPYLCTCTKLYLLIGILCVGMSGFGVIEWLGIRADRTVSDNKPALELMNDRNIDR
ncbi:UNC93-like protein [Trachymyrmex septentrionalis]|uniref:UNC93-like protein n=1 Tax=Trachymyrmex septentrionalis TaxID=34720 RepID=A0A195F7N1_9HYME|nr:PREDICTED: UNC93-like protein [Trachymyrmex septentrionalis]XP_018346481.1 PREDICTED: UNC93-like protein [Trachymyrmex septentrionalis]XP_018346482.1 PREDICTED: UNC93-like protein [Trachymyrmex septentrionalis]XP_018346483.1 PREDICTED: UNC93-like protein [Trachymyrmex septentrionalis]KYN36192.1 UNC93-like protein [Trachymyrmex septentrionalis]